jgi:selenide,water dikinase
VRRAPLRRRPAPGRAPFYLARTTIRGGTKRNWDGYGPKVAPLTGEGRAILCGPQTSGGLVVAVDPAGRDDFLRVTRARELELARGGIHVDPGEVPVVVR